MNSKTEGIRALLEQAKHVRSDSSIGNLYLIRAVESLCDLLDYEVLEID